MFAAVLGLPLLVAGCPPLDSTGANRGASEGEPGTYHFFANKLYDADAAFDIRDKVIYPRGSDPPGDLRTNVSNRELAMNRCTRCHECGFKQAWDEENFGTAQWSPRYTGDEWTDPVRRMRVKEYTFLNEQIAERIYSYLRDETLGVYEEEEDTGAAVMIEVDELPIRVEEDAGGEQDSA